MEGLEAQKKEKKKKQRSKTKKNGEIIKDEGKRKRRYRDKDRELYLLAKIQSVRSTTFRSVVNWISSVTFERAARIFDSGKGKDKRKKKREAKK